MSEDKSELEIAFNEHMLNLKFDKYQVPIDAVIKSAMKLSKFAIQEVLFWMVEDGRLPRGQADAFVSMWEIAIGARKDV